MASESRRATLRRYRVSDKNKAVQARYAATPAGKEARRGIEARYVAANLDKRNAKRAVAYAVLRGRLPRVSNMPCFDCLGDASHYHHPSYAREHRLRVVPLCAKCHSTRHQQAEATS